jgi:hypothetical protein
LHGSPIHLTDIRRGLDRAAVRQTFGDAFHGLFRHLRVFPQGAAPFTETLPAIRAVQSPNVFAFAVPLDNAEIARVESIERRAIFIGTRQPC